MSSSDNEKYFYIDSKEIFQRLWFFAWCMEISAFPLWPSTTNPSQYMGWRI